MFLFCRLISVIVVVAVAFIAVISSVVASAFLVIVIVYRCLLGKIVLHLIKCVVVDIYILIKLAIALVIGLNTNNLATEKLSSRKILYKAKSDVTNGYACIVRILIIFVLAPFFSIAIFK